MRDFRLLAFSLLALTALPHPACAGAYDDMLFAVRENRTEAVFDLLRRGMDPNTADPSGTTLLMYVAANGNEQLLEILLANRANALKQNKYGDTALALAALNGHLNVVRRMVDYGAQINGPEWNALHYAVFNGHAEIVRFLVSKGARLNTPAPNQQTPLMLAARNGHPEVARLLLEAGADRDVGDSDGNTALGIALKAGNDNVAGFLRTSAGPAR
jgi:ankyrin repeat protein